MSKVEVELLAKGFEASINATVAAAKKVKEGKRMRQAQKGKSHPTWLLGHMAGSLDSVVNGYGFGNKPQLPKEFRKKFAPDFAGGDPITSEAADYPAWDEVVANYELAGKSVLESLRKLEDSELPGALRGPVPPPLASMWGNLGNMMQMMTAHDSYHRGQMALLAALD